jgi:hypothetical protein
MLHALALIEIENGGAENFPESSFEITFVDGYLPAQGLDGYGVANVLQQDLTGFEYLLPVGLIVQEFTTYVRLVLAVIHAIKAVQQKDLCLCVYENVGEAVGVIMIQQGFYSRPCFAANGKCAAE